MTMESSRPKYANGDTNLARCTKGLLIDIVRECQRALLDLNETHMDLIEQNASASATSVQEPVGHLQHSRDGVWVHLKHGSKSISINLSADRVTQAFANAFAKDHPADAKMLPLYAAAPTPAQGEKP